MDTFVSEDTQHADPRPTKIQVQTTAKGAALPVPRKTETISFKMTDLPHKQVAPTKPREEEGEKNPDSSTKREKDEWDGKKVFEVDRLIALFGKEKTYMRMTDTITLTDCWFLPLSLSRSSSTTHVKVLCRVFMCGDKLYYFDHLFKFPVDDLFKILYMCVKSREPDVCDYAGWVEFSQEYFEKEPVVHGDGSPAALAEFLFTREHFRLCEDEDSPFRICFRKATYHEYRPSESGLGKAVDNPNVFLCRPRIGKYNYTLESRIMLIPFKASH